MNSVVPTEEESGSKLEIELGETTMVGLVVLRTSEERDGVTSITVDTPSVVRDGVIN